MKDEKRVVFFYETFAQFELLNGEQIKSVLNAVACNFMRRDRSIRTIPEDKMAKIVYYTIEANMKRLGYTPNE